jgi:hypothetical protein
MLSSYSLASNPMKRGNKVPSVGGLNKFCLKNHAHKKTVKLSSWMNVHKQNKLDITFSLQEPQVVAATASPVILTLPKHFYACPNNPNR